MKVGDRFTKDGKNYEVTRIIDSKNYGFKEVAEEPVFQPTFDEEVEKEVVKSKGRGRKKG